MKLMFKSEFKIHKYCNDNDWCPFKVKFLYIPVSEAAFSTSTQSSETTMYVGDGKEAKLVESALNDIK